MESHVKKMKYSKFDIDKNIDKIIEFDNSLCELTGYTQEEIKNLSYKDLIPEEDFEEYFNLLYNELVVNNKSELYLEHRLKNKDGEKFYVLCLGHKNFDELGNITSSTIRIFRLSQTLAIISKQQEVISVLDKINELEHDELTGLLRRAPYIEIVNDLLKEKENFMFIMADIDNFKNINDIYGHMVGDEVLKEISKRFRKIPNSILCRLGGDEISAIVKGVKTEEEAVKIAMKLKEEINNINIKEDLKIGISMGVTIIYSNNNYTFNDLYEKTDRALYVSKNSGKNSYTICE